MTAGRRSAAVLVGVLLLLAVPATAWAADTDCDGSNDLLRLDLDEECGLEVTVLGVDVRLGGNESEAEAEEAEPGADSTSSPAPSPSEAEPSPDDPADRDGSARSAGAAADPEDGSTAVGSGDDTPADPESSSPAMESAAGTASPSPHHAAAGDTAQAAAEPRPAPDVPAAAPVDGRGRQSVDGDSQHQDSAVTRIAGPLASVPGMNQPSLLGAAVLVATAAALTALGVGVAAKGLSLARRRQRPVPSQ